MALARIYHQQGEGERALQACEYALRLAPHSPEVLSMLDSLRHGGQLPVSESDSYGLDDDYELASVGDLTPTSLDGDGAEDRGSPVERARYKALSDLAESFFAEEAPTSVPGLSKPEMDALLGQAINAQTAGQVDQAIAAYEKALRGGVDQPAVHFNLGLLYQEKLHFDAAISELEHTAIQPDYRLGSLFALGECFRAKGRINESVEHFVEALKIVDLATVQRDQADDLIQLYEHLADGLISTGDTEQAIAFTNSLVSFLNEQGWEDKVIQARQKLDAMTEEGPILSLAEMLSVPSSDSILQSVALAQEYAKRTMYYAALEECYFALDHAPTYLPIHRQIAQVLIAMGKVEEALAKYVVIADAYLTSGNVRQGIAIYERSLKLAPMDTMARGKLIKILISHGKINEALEHYLILADSYYHMAQMDKARETYDEAMKLAPRGTPENQWQVRILHKVGDIDMQRVDWRKAMEVYSRIRKIAPDDERARLTLVDLHYRMNRPDRALAELDELITMHVQDGKQQRVFSILEDAVETRPEDLPIRTRLAQAYLDAGDVEKALEHLDKLGDLQLETGQYQDAKTTIKAIIMLRPPNIAAYQQLLEQLDERTEG